MLSLSTNAFAASAATGFFQYFLTTMKNYGTLRETVTKSSLGEDEKSSLLQPIANTPSSRRLPRLRFENGIFLFTDRGHIIRVDPINPQQGLFKINSKMVLLSVTNWPATELAIERAIHPPDAARAMIIAMFASWYACEKESCPNAWINTLASNYRAQYVHYYGEDRRPAQKRGPVPQIP